MANENHLKIIKQGIDLWNEWRSRYKDVVPDLSNADLSGTKLIKAKLYHAQQWAFWVYLLIVTHQTFRFLSMRVPTVP